MNQKQKETITTVMQVIFPIVIVIALIEALVIGGVITFDETTATLIDDGLANKEEVTATVIIKYGDEDMESWEITSPNATVYGFLLECAEEGGLSIKTTYYGQYDSILVDSIGLYAGGQDDKYWQYYLNGEYASIGADKQIVKNGDIIEWRFEGFSF